jgi:hypothetical protein
MKTASLFKSTFDDIAKVESDWQPYTMGSEPDLVKTLGEGRLSLTTAVKDSNGRSIFTRDFPQDERTDQMDHLKFSLLANGPHDGRFVVPDEGSISVEAQMGATVSGLENQPFGTVVQDAQSDFRLGTGVLMLMDSEHMNVFDFFVTNTEIYAVYERGKSKG